MGEGAARASILIALFPERSAFNAARDLIVELVERGHRVVQCGCSFGTLVDADPGARAPRAVDERAGRLHRVDDGAARPSSNAELVTRPLPH